MYTVGIVKKLSAACAMRSTIWKQLGYQLSLDQTDLNIIAANNPHDVERCCSAMFNLWLDKQPDASWEILRKALVAVELEQLASIMNQQLSTEYMFSNGSAGASLDVTSKNTYLKSCCSDPTD